MFIHSLQCQPAALFQQATFPWWKKSSCSLKINLLLFMLSAESCFKKSLDVSCCCSTLNCATKETFLKDKHHVTSMPSSECFYLPSELFKYREDGWYHLQFKKTKRKTGEGQEGNIWRKRTIKVSTDCLRRCHHYLRAASSVFLSTMITL